ncbi:MAG: RDD family protein [Chthoniobacterales bacterium]
MNWYYAENTTRKGPFDETAFAELLKSGRITPDTLVWRENFADWKPYREVAPALATEEGEAACAECGRTFPKSEMIQYEGSWICATCKPIFFQRVREGITPRGEVTYGGFWIRLVAKFVDGIVLQVAGLGLRFVVSLMFDPTKQVGAFLVVDWILSLIIGASYATYFVGKFGATPGKMACRLRIVMADGSKVTYLRAFGRHFAEILSSITLGIGYIMAAFDDEKRSLHDRVCDTRVIRLNA